MIHYEFIEMNIGHITAMTNLLIHRQNQEIEVYPFFNNSAMNAIFIHERLQEKFKNNKIIGTCAFYKEELLGYIFGEIQISNTKGRFAWAPYEGIAIRSDQSYELIRQLYAKAAKMWLEHGCFSHSIFVPLGNKHVFEAVMKLSFAIEQVYAVMKIESYEPFQTVTDVNCRRAHQEDQKALG